MRRRRPRSQACCGRSCPRSEATRRASSRRTRQVDGGRAAGRRDRAQPPILRRDDHGRAGGERVPAHLVALADQIEELVDRARLQMRDRVVRAEQGRPILVDPGRARLRPPLHPLVRAVEVERGVGVHRVEPRAEILLRGAAEQRRGDPQLGRELPNRDGPAPATRVNGPTGQMEAPVEAATSGSLQNPRWNFDRAKLFQNLPLISTPRGGCGLRAAAPAHPWSAKFFQGPSGLFRGFPGACALEWRA